MPKRSSRKDPHPVNNPNVMGLHAAVVEQRRLQTLSPQAALHHVQDGLADRRTDQVGQHRGADHEAEPPRRRRHLRHDGASLQGLRRLLTPFVDSKGNFGKSYSRDMSWAAPRYTEAKLSAICGEIFKDIDSDTVDFVDNYDNTMKEPALLPTTFPNILVSANSGIAVGMASQFCGFNLKEVCETTVAYLKNPDCDLTETLLAPDFPTGGELIFDTKAIEDIYNTGRGSVRVRAKYRYVKDQNLLEIYEIPYSTTVEAILDKVAELIKAARSKRSPICGTRRTSAA